jgi:hypothetical protein
MPAARINRELCSTSEKANPRPIRVMSSMVRATDSPLPSGLAHQRAIIMGTMAATTRASQPLRGPSWSMEAPRKGAVAMTIQPEYWLHWEMTAWPRTGSPTMTDAT